MRFLFVALPNGSGSTIVYDVISKSKNVVALPKEGHYYFGSRSGFNPFIKGMVWTEDLVNLQNPLKYDWPSIEQFWCRQWRKVDVNGYEQGSVLMEKSPPNVGRAKMMQDHFGADNCAFILGLRNPYAVVEGLIRRFDFPVERCVQHWVQCARLQVENKKLLKNWVWISYEDMYSQPLEVNKRVRELFLGRLDDVDFSNAMVSVHNLHDNDGARQRSIVDFNSEQIARLSNDQINHVTSLLMPHLHMIEKLGYNLIINV